MRKHQSSLIKSTIINRILNYYINDNELSDIINETLYFENKRLQEDNTKREYKKDIKIIKSIQKDLLNADKKTKIEILERISVHYTEEISNFLNPFIYKTTTIIIPFIIASILNKISLKQIIKNPFYLLSIKKNLLLKGEIETLKKLSKIGTIIITPTHVSNLDSPLIGWATHSMGLKPLIYGAGLDSFESIINNLLIPYLGTYTIDRKKHDSLYKKVLKEYAIFSLENNYGNLFFPGGTRSRSGKLESKLKKGLLGTGLIAYQNNLKTNKKKKDIFYIPVNLTYQSVIEESSLINEYLDNKKEKRKKNYFLKLYQKITFFYKIFSLDAKIILNFGEAFDPFGNPVNEKGESLDSNGNIINKKKYFLNDNNFIISEEKTLKYTNKLASSIISTFQKNNTIMPIHFISYIAFKLLRNENSYLSLNQFLKKGVKIKTVSLDKFYKAMKKDLKTIRFLYSQNKIDLDENMKNKNSDEILNSVLKYISLFKNKKVLYIKNSYLYSKNLRILYFYQNHLNITL